MTSSSKAKAGWRQIGDKRVYCRSKWEANYGRYLQFLKEESLIEDWDHEPKTFWFPIKRGVVSYLPDFLVTNIENHPIKTYWVEVKGFWDARSKTKVKRFYKYFPEEVLKTVDGNWFKENNPKMRVIIKEWE